MCICTCTYTYIHVTTINKKEEARKWGRMLEFMCYSLVKTIFLLSIAKFPIVLSVELKPNELYQYIIACLLVCSLFGSLKTASNIKWF